MTVLEAQVTRENWGKLKSIYNEKTQQVPAEIKATYLVQDKASPETWRIITIWESQAYLDNMRSSRQTPTGVIIFNQADAEPKLTVFDIAATA